MLLEAENGYMPSHDGTAHAERLLATQACTTIDANILRNATLYSSAEPCAMCAGAIYWAGIGRLVYGLSEHRLREITGNHPENPTLNLPCREVFASGQRATEVVGPLLEDEAAARALPGSWEGKVSRLMNEVDCEPIALRKMAPRGTSRRHRLSPGERSGG